MGALQLISIPLIFLFSCAYAANIQSCIDLNGKNICFGFELGFSSNSAVTLSTHLGYWQENLFRRVRDIGMKIEWDEKRYGPDFFTEEEKSAFEEAVERLTGKDEVKLSDLARNIRDPSGSIALPSLLRRGTSAIVYISTNPIAGKLHVADDFPETYSEYISSYGHLIMAVGSRKFENSEVFENRGITKTPHAFLDNSFKGLSILLHGFTSACWQSIYPDIAYFIVLPVPSMQNILCKAFSGLELSIGTNEDYIKDLFDVCGKFHPRAFFTNNGRSVAIVKTGIDIRGMPFDQIGSDQIELEFDYFKTGGEYINIVSASTLSSKFHGTLVRH